LLGGVVGPVAFVAAWAIGGALAEGYSPRDDAISELAAVGATTRPLMTAGFVLFGAGMIAFSRALERGPAVAAVAAGVCTIGVAAVPLDAGYDGLHGALAGAGYAALVAVPATAAMRLRPSSGAVAAAVAVVAGACLVASVVVTGPNGLFQRLGLTLVDAWLAVTAVRMWRRRSVRARA
jgi:hypothetical membrane protein